MSKVGSWSTTPGNNNSTPPDGWPEGQLPSTVNDCAREMMAQIKTVANSLEFIDLNNVPSYLTATTFSLGAADTNFEVGRRLKLFDATTLYGTIISVSSTFVQVQLDSGALTTSLTSVALGIVRESNHSLPQHVYRRKNILINGQMDIWQRGNTFQPANNVTTYTADRFAWNQSSNAAIAISRWERSANASNVPTVAQSGVFFTSALLVSVSAADAVAGAGKFSTIDYKVEGYDYRQIAGKPFTLSFWANTNRSGTYAVAFRNTGGTQAFVQTYAINTINAWTQVAITAVKSPTTGTWDYSSGTGLQISFVLAAGTTFQGGAGNWTAANIMTTASQTNFVLSAGNVFAITGVQLEEGKNATPLELIPIQWDVNRAQRYYWRGLSSTSYNFPAYTAGCINSWRIAFPVTMRAIPNIAMSAPGITTQFTAGNPSVDNPSVNNFRLIASASIQAVNVNFAFAVSDFVEADAEL